MQEAQREPAGSPAAGSAVSMAFEGRRRDRDLVFYSLSTCDKCREAQQYLQEKGFAYRLVLVDQLPADEKKRLKEELGHRVGIRVAFPALLIDGTRMVLGFFRVAWDEALGEKAGG